MLVTPACGLADCGALYLIGNGAIKSCWSVPFRVCWIPDWVVWIDIKNSAIEEHAMSAVGKADAEGFTGTETVEGDGDNVSLGISSVALGLDAVVINC